MNARLLIVNPKEAAEPPLVPSMLVENEGKVMLCGDFWAIPIKPGRLEEITLDDLRGILRLRAEDQVYLSAPREMTSEDLMSDDVLSSARQWWTETVAEIEQKEPMAHVS